MTCGSRKYAKRAPAASSRITNSSSSTTRKRSLKRRPSKSCRRITEFCRPQDRKSTRLNSSHSQISYAVFCLKKKKKADNNRESHATQGNQSGSHQHTVSTWHSDVHKTPARSHLPRYPHPHTLAHILSLAPFT